MYTNTKIRILAGILTIFLMIFGLMSHVSAATKIVYPLKEISELECRFQKFSDLGSDCKQKLPVLNTKDYKKYATKNGGYNDYTRIYTVLWGSSYKYGWDVGYGGHQGTDIATAQGTPVYSIADGTVIVAKTDAAWGKVVSVKHNINGKTIVSDYAHLHKIDVKVGDKVDAGEKIGEVGSTGNSTGNHLHFQIDFESKFYPYYYDYNACPYSYYQITENGVCFDELEKNTIDPLLFLETNGAALNDIVTTKKIDVTSTSSSNTDAKGSSKTGEHDPTIFNRTVHIGYPESDIREVQMIFTDLKLYKGPISGDYTDIEDDIIEYQIDEDLIADEDDYGAGWFGPKTRAEVQKDYARFIKRGGERKTISTVKNTSTKTTTTKNAPTTERISRDSLLSREEIEAREVADFMKNYNLDLKFADATGRVAIGETKILELTVTNSRGKPFRGNLPGNITFNFDNKKIKVFPTEFYYFTNGKRDIHVTGLAKGSTNLEIKFGASTLKKVFINVTNVGEDILASQGTIISHTTGVIGEEKPGVILFKDEHGQRLIQTKYKGSFTLKATGDAEVCIKRGSLKDIKSIYRRGCDSSDYQKEITFDYDDTVAGLALYSYKVYDSNAKIELIKAGTTTAISYKNVKATAPKGLLTTHDYYGDVMNVLENGVVSDINQGYFLQDRAMTSKDANLWIRNTLDTLQDETVSPTMKKTISQNIATLQAESGGYEYITREEFLDKAYKYLILNDDTQSSSSRKYLDLDEETNMKANAFFDQDTTWKDQFGENYYRPGVKITRGEVAFLLTRSIEKNKEIFLTLR